MSVASAVRAAFAELVANELPDVQVSPYPLAENQSPRECVHLEQARSRFEWRSIGPAANNRTEDIEIDIVVHVYREAPDQRDAALAAEERCSELLEAVETAVVEDSAGAFTAGGSMTQARIGEWTVTPTPMEKGWTFTGRATLTGRNHP